MSANFWSNNGRVFEQQLLDKLDELINEVRKLTANNSNEDNIVNINIKLMDKLKQVRMDIAKEFNVPAYMIFTDKTLDDMIWRMPKNEQEFLRCFGVGPQKLKFAERFLQVING